jgi:tetratricopeptide (TPR) repeat protein
VWLPDLAGRKLIWCAAVRILVKTMKRTSIIAPGSLNRIVQTANEAWERRDFQQCFEQLERAHRLAPANLQVLLNLGQRYGLRWRYADAERCFEQASRVAPNPAETLALAGQIAAEFYNPQMAERCFQAALKHKNVAANTIARLGEIYERLHRAEDAAAMAERALHVNPACPLARLTQAKLHRQAGRLAEAEQALLPNLTSANREFRVRSYYELGTIYDRQGHYDHAMSALFQAKELLRADAPPLLGQLQLIIKHLNEMKQNVSAETFKKWTEADRDFLQPVQRLAFLGGHARSGTTLLEQVLDAHPEIISAEETTIFHDDAYKTLRNSVPGDASMLAGLNSASAETLKLACERYFKSMSACLGQDLESRLLIDKNPSLQALIITFARIFPEAKMIVALRDPRDVVLSCFMLPHFPMSTASVAFLDFESTVNTYTRVLGIWQTLKPLIQNPWIELRYEDMVQDLESAARRALAFLGVSWNDRVLGFHEHAQKKLVHSPTYADVTQPIYKRARGRWRNYQKYLEPHLAKLEPFVKAFGYE